MQRLETGLGYLAELANCGVARAAALELVAEQTGQPIWRRAVEHPEALGPALGTALADHQGSRLAEVCLHLAEWLSLDRQLSAADRYWWGRGPRWFLLTVAAASGMRFLWQLRGLLLDNAELPDPPWPLLVAVLAWLVVSPLVRRLGPTTALGDTARHFLAVKALVRCGLPPWQAARLAPMPGPDDPVAERLMEWGCSQGQSDRAAELLGEWASDHHLARVERALQLDETLLPAFATGLLVLVLTWACWFWGLTGVCCNLG